MALPRSLPDWCYSVSSVTLRTVVSPKKQQLLDTKTDLTKMLLIMAHSPPDTAVSPTRLLQQFSSRLPFFSRDSYTTRSCRSSSWHFSCLGTVVPAATAPTVAPQSSLATILTSCSSSITILRPRLPMVLVVGTSMVWQMKCMIAVPSAIQVPLRNTLFQMLCSCWKENTTKLLQPHH